MNKVARYPSKTIIGSQADMDALEVDNGGMDDEEYKTHMSIWALSASQLVMGTDIRKLSPSSLSIYTRPCSLSARTPRCLAASATGAILWTMSTNTARARFLCGRGR